MTELQKKVYIPLLSLWGISAIGFVYASTQGLDGLVSTFGSVFVILMMLLLVALSIEALFSMFITDERFARGNSHRLAVKYRILQLRRNVSSLSSARKKGFLLFNKTYFKLDKLHFRSDEIQWCGRDTNSYDIRLDVKVDDKWYIIKIDADHDGQEFVDNFLKSIPKKLRHNSSLYRPNVRGHKVVSAHITEQNLQGIYDSQQAVDLYITPLWLVILQNKEVIEQHFIDDIADIHWNKHPQSLDDDMYLVQYTLHDETYTYALSDSHFIEQLSQVMYGQIDEVELRKKKSQ